MPGPGPVLAERRVAPSPVPLAMVWPGPERGHESLVVPTVALNPGDMLVEVELSTICGSDVHTVQGHRTSPAPCVLGHEQVGRIVAVGPGARASDGTPLENGARVVWSVTVGCGDCDRCRRGLSQKCHTVVKYGHERIRDGWELSGGFASHVHVRAGTAVVTVPEALPAAVVAPASCATATIVAALDAASELVPLAGTTVLVTGAGMLGLTACAMATDAGATVIVTDPDAGRRGAALRFGAAAVADPTEPLASASALATVLGGLDGAGIPQPLIALELSGADQAVVTALDCVDVGGVVVLVGSVSPSFGVRLEPVSIVRRMLTVRGVHNYAPAHLARAVDYLSEAWRRYPFASLVGATFALDEIDEALEVAGSGAHPRVGLSVSGRDPGVASLEQEKQGYLAL